MRRLARVLAALAFVTATGVAGASAAGLSGLGTGGLGAGVTAVAPCDANGFTATYHSTAGAVERVTVGGIADPGCEGGTLSAVLVSSSGTALAAAGPQTLLVDVGTTDDSVELTFAPAPAVGSVARLHVAVTGP